MQTKPVMAILILVVLDLLILCGCGSNERKKIDMKERLSDEELDKFMAKANSNALLFGFDLRASPEEDARQYLPFLNYLEKVTGYNLELHFTSKKSSIVSDLGRGVVQFAAIGAVSYILAHEEYGVLSVARGLNLLGKAEYQAVIIVLPNSPIRKIEELRGRRFAFGGVTSTQGSLIPRIILAKHGISLNDFTAYAYTGSHQNCADAVISGRYDAGGIQDTMGKGLAELGLVRILFTSQYFPSSGIAANKEVAPEVLVKVKKALLNFQPQGRDAAGLFHWDKTEMPKGFIEAQDSDYSELRQWMKRLGYPGTSNLE